MMRKSGLSMASMVVYVALFFAFSSFAVAISSNFNYKTLNEKGYLWINEQYDKLQYNLIKSAKQSDDISEINGNIVFSNNDEYKYDSDKKQILKNDGVIAQDVEDFEIVDSSNFIEDEALDTNIGSIGINVKFSKYGNEKTFSCFVSSGDGLSE